MNFLIMSTKMIRHLGLKHSLSPGVKKRRLEARPNLNQRTKKDINPIHLTLKESQDPKKAKLKKKKTRKEKKKVRLEAPPNLNQRTKKDLQYQFKKNRTSKKMFLI